MHHGGQGSADSQAGTLLAVVGLELMTGLLAATLLARLLISQRSSAQ
jgi:hypothetical protein